MMSGGPMRKFTEGWAVKLFSWGSAHYFTRDGAGLAKAACGAQSAPVAALREAGTWKRCRRCSASQQKGE